VSQRPAFQSLNTLEPEPTAEENENQENQEDKMIIETSAVDEPQEVGRQEPEAIQEENVITVEETKAAATEEKCQYCNVNFSVEVIEIHREDCEFRKIFCETCGEFIVLEMFEYHLNECNMDDIDDEEESENMEGDGTQRDSMEEEGRPARRRNPNIIPESEMTYERLLMLDENAVVKGMSEEEIKEFKVSLYVKSLDGIGSCVVCMEEYETGGYLRKLSCKHEFHKECIDKWLESHFTCPTCKKELR